MQELDPRSQAGFSLLSTLIMAGVLGVVTSGIYQLMNYRMDLLKTTRMHQRMDLFESKLKNTARSLGAMNVSAQRNAGSRLALCLNTGNCQANGIRERLVLYDARGQRVSGLFDLNGRACGDNCPIEVQTEVEIFCNEGTSSCPQPSEIKTYYEIRRANANYFKGRDFPPVLGTASLATFVCPDGEYIRGITLEGRMLCGPAELSPLDVACKAGTAAVGVDSKGFLKCVEIVDYCQVPIAFSLVLDTSSSMKKNDKVTIAKQALNNFIGFLDAKRDRGAFVSFNKGATLRTGLTGNYQNIKTAIDGEQAKLGTNMGAGLQIGAQALENAQASEKKLMIFVSDGRNTRGQDPVREAAKIKEQGVRIFTVGFSEKADRETLRRVASSPADYYDATQLNQLKGALEQIVSLTCRKP
ncbi:vWA domain-containing protein [Oligoflexus tunisiensis]|uniref:vWA domain-containing protein n=1 Tax=Oligoflexus tunisiensis TaxID=708132 RepID=UPI00114CE4F8|nr:vWA domain-containing protein [Oligoflexus tunisiensis]